MPLFEKLPQLPGNLPGTVLLNLPRCRLSLRENGKRQVQLDYGSGEMNLPRPSGAVCRAPVLPSPEQDWPAIVSRVAASEGSTGVGILIRMRAAGTFERNSFAAGQCPTVRPKRCKPAALVDGARRSPDAARRPTTLRALLAAMRARGVAIASRMTREPGARRARVYGPIPAQQTRSAYAVRDAGGDA